MLHSQTKREVRCPRCGGRARFEEPFEFIGGPTPPADSPLWKLPRHDGWFVRERFPSLLPWTSGEAYYARLPFTAGSERGITQCLHCHDARIHDMRWPQDAFWQWPVRGSVLWAFSREHAQALREFVSRSHRDPADFDALFAGFLARIPSEFLRSQVRDEIVKAIDRSLG